ncbi:MAG: hypothetical protein KAH15_05745 [Candidatus Marinimicrobia bacterium]|nr:hypothetical protein [Candidatus Neomarinimicrobiota bacterium]
MKRFIFALILACSITYVLTAQEVNLKPYTLAGIQQGTKQDVHTMIIDQLEKAGFTIEGTYSPMQSDTLTVICISHPTLLLNAKNSGGLLGFASVLRVGLHQTSEGIEVTYTTPAYWGNAYYRDQYSEVAADYVSINTSLKEVFASLSNPTFLPFGSKKGLSTKTLRKYHYMMAMPYFDDVVELAKDLPYEEAVKRIEERVQTNPDANIVYSVKFPIQGMALYGIALTGDDGEKKFLPTIDIGEPGHTPFLPYELLVLRDKTVMLHGRYRIALSFPDLTMGTFMKIMSTPGYIAKIMGALVEDIK